MLTTVFCATLAIALLFPETTAGKLLRRLLIELPARKLDQLTPARIAFGLLIAAAIALAIVVAKIEGLILSAQAIPEGLVWFAAFDVATYIDVIGLVLLVAATVRFRTAYQAIRSAAARARQWAAHCVGAIRERLQYGARDRSHRTRRKGSPPPKDEGHWRGLVFSLG
jgi:hypothetical protein